MMTDYTLAECQALFDTLFPEGSMAAPSIMAELAPEGWENTAYQRGDDDRLSAAEAYANHVELDAKMRPMMGDFADEIMGKLQTFEEFERDYNVSPLVEMQELIANCVWDIFSDNNEVVKDGKIYEIGSFRGAAGFIADWLNLRSEKQYKYTDFYMGNTAGELDKDLKPVYEWVFRRLKAAGCDWIFHFTQMGIVDFSGMREADESVRHEDYDPTKAMQAELERAQKARELQEFRDKLENMNAQAREDALYKPPPTAIQAYQAVYGRFPKGWPPA
jgi:hypothetical protein